jgi:glycosyltransferase involved in cell wall biosynthesis
MSEGFPAIITEAGAANNLIISSDFHGIEYVLTGNEDGFIFKQDDVDALHDKMRSAINNYAEHKNKSMKFYTKVKDWFNIDTMINKHIELYEKP